MELMHYGENGQTQKSGHQYKLNHRDVSKYGQTNIPARPYRTVGFASFHVYRVSSAHAWG